jgi:peroxiredoxin
MKNVLAILALALAVISCQTAKDKYSIKGTIEGADTGKVYLLKLAEGQPVAIDTAELKDGKFSFEGKMDIADIRFLRLNDQDYFAQFFLENASVTVAAQKDSLQKTKITGSASQDVFQIFIDEMERLNKEMVGLQEKYQAAMMSGNTADVDKVKIDYQAMIDNNTVFAKNFVKEHPTSVVSAFIVLNQLAPQLEDAELESIVGSFAPEIAASEYVVKLKEMVTERKKTAIGAEAPDFTLNDPDGKPIALSSLRGKVVLIDFWASWCGPCRQENPNVVRMYKEFQPRGFEILGVSLDRGKDEWVKAIQDDQLTWLHVSDLQYWQCAPARLYGVNSIPQTFLLDKDGKIIGKGLRGEKLEAKLKELFPN